MNGNARKQLDIPDIKEFITKVKNNASPNIISTSYKISLPSAYNWMNKLSAINYDPVRAGELIKNWAQRIKTRLSGIVRFAK